MTAQNPLIRLEKHHVEVEKHLVKLGALVNDIEAQGMEAFKMHHHDLVKLRHQILTSSDSHFRQEEEVLFPEIKKVVPGSEGVINNFLEDHARIKGLYHDLVFAINEEKTEEFVETAQEAIEALQQHIKKEDAYFNEIGHGWLKPEKFESMSHQMNVIEKEIEETALV